MRVLVYTGKGGVGKTSVSTATALRCAELGYKTLILSTDAAHSLADALDITLGAEPVEVGPNLWAQEVNALHELEQNWGQIQSFLTDVLAWQGLDEITSREVIIIPGSEEILSLMRIKEHYDRGRFDVIIVDAAPTGETLRLLGMPDILRWWVKRLFPTVRSLMKLVRPVVQRVSNIPMASDKVFGSLEDMIQGLEGVRQILSDPTVSSVRVVLNLEKIVIKEAQRSLSYLNLFGYNTDAIIVNRVLPEADYGSFGTRMGMQKKYDQVVAESFTPLPILKVPMFEQEVVGQEMLRVVATALYGNEDPTRFLFQGQVQTITRREENYVLSLKLPFVVEEQVELAQHADELVVEIGWYRRSIILPQSLARLTATEATFENGQLEILFPVRTAPPSLPR